MGQAALSVGHTAKRRIEQMRGAGVIEDQRAVALSKQDFVCTHRSGRGRCRIAADIDCAGADAQFSDLEGSADSHMTTVAHCQRAFARLCERRTPSSNFQIARDIPLRLRAVNQRRASSSGAFPRSPVVAVTTAPSVMASVPALYIPTRIIPSMFQLVPTR